MSNWTYVLTSYLLCWAVLAGYTVLVSRRLHRAQAAVEGALSHTEVEP